MTAKMDKILTKLFDELEAEYRKLSPCERETWVLKIKEEFSANIKSIQQHVNEVEYGEHIEGLYFFGRDSLQHRPFPSPFSAYKR